MKKWVSIKNENIFLKWVIDGWIVSYFGVIRVFFLSLICGLFSRMQAVARKWKAKSFNLPCF